MFKQGELDLQEFNLYHGDCLDVMKIISDDSVDMVLADPPYGTTACKWDSIIPLEPMWKQLKRITKKNGAIVMTASQPFTSVLVVSNLKMFKYCWVWKKNRPTGHVHAKNKPLKIHEDICVFAPGVTLHKGQTHKRMNYYPQGLKRIDKLITAGPTPSEVCFSKRKSHKASFVQTHTGYPNSVVIFSNTERALHPTQKPVALMEYLIKTYTNENETVLGFTMGSGTTGVACKNLNRNFIGIEKDEKYFQIAKDRIKNHIKE